MARRDDLRLLEGLGRPSLRSRYFGALAERLAAPGHRALSRRPDAPRNRLEFSLNVAAVSLRWDAYPFILLNLASRPRRRMRRRLILLAETGRPTREGEVERDREVNARSLAEAEFLAREIAAVAARGRSEGGTAPTSSSRSSGWRSRSRRLQPAEERLSGRLPGAATAARPPRRRCSSSGAPTPGAPPRPTRVARPKRRGVLLTDPSRRSSRPSFDVRRVGRAGAVARAAGRLGSPWRSVRRIRVDVGPVLDHALLDLRR